MDMKNIAEEIINKTINAYNYEVQENRNLSESLLQIFVGTTGTTRLGPVPKKETQNEILRRINIKLKKSEPLEVSCAWGAIKTIAKADKNIDLAEYLTFLQYNAIYKLVKRIYKPGIRFNIYIGDSYYEYLYGSNEQINTYCDSMIKLAEGMPEINIIKMSKQEKRVKNVNNVCEHNYSLLKDYWIDTQDIPEEKFCNVLSYKKLCENGWIGNISNDMRKFYLKRMQILFPTENESYWTEKILRFFSYGMMISQNDLMGRKSAETSTVDSCLLRIPPPGLPRKLYSNRIRMRIAPKKIVKNSAPPWSVVGAVSINDTGKAHIRLINSSTYNKLKIKKTVYNDIPYVIFLEKDNLIKK